MYITTASKVAYKRYMYIKLLKKGLTSGVFLKTNFINLHVFIMLSKLVSHILHLFGLASKFFNIDILAHHL